MDYNCKPIVTWPDVLTPAGKRKRAQFSTTYARTLAHLERELKHLKAKYVVFQLALDESEIRLDGRPYASAKPRHPGVIVTFESKHGPLSYWTDQYTDWKANVRAITLGLAALRVVDRHAVNKSGSQYAGYKRLNAAPPSATYPLSREIEAAVDFLAEHSGFTKMAVASSPTSCSSAYMDAAMRLHPDRQHGDEELFKRLQEHKRVMEAFHRCVL